MEIIDNVNKTLKEDLTTEIHKGSKVSIAAACFSIYAFAELKKELKNVDELRFIFTTKTSKFTLIETSLNYITNIH